MKVARLTELNEENANRLSETFADGGAIAKYISTGIAELWSLNNGDSLSVIVFDKPGRIVWVLCYVGKDLKTFVRLLKINARKAGYSRIVFATQKTGIARMMRQFGFTDAGTLYEVMI